MLQRSICWSSAGGTENIVMLLPLTYILPNSVSLPHGYSSRMEGCGSERAELLWKCSQHIQPDSLRVLYDDYAPRKMHIWRISGELESFFSQAAEKSEKLLLFPAIEWMMEKNVSPTLDFLFQYFFSHQILLAFLYLRFVFIRSEMENSASFEGLFLRGFVQILRR